MPYLMRCCVKQPEDCLNYVVYDVTIYTWIQVALPQLGVLYFCH